MKALKYILVSLIILTLIFVGFGYMQDKEVAVSRSIVIDAPIAMIFDQFNDLEKRLKWSPWEQNDSTMVTQLGEITKGVGASYSWTSENSGNGEILYTEVVPDQLIETELRFGPDEENPGQGLAIFTPVSDGIRVTWEMHSNMGNNPFMRLMGRYMDDIVGPTFEQGLLNIKNICENENAQAQFLIDHINESSISEIEVEGKPCISILDSCSVDEMGERFEGFYTDLAEFAEKNNLHISGYPRAIYHVWNPPSKVVYEPLFVLQENTVESTDIIGNGTTYEGKVITATHIGPYDKSAQVWEALDNYLKTHNLESNGSPWEQYENTPRDEPDPNKLITHIFMPVK